MKFQLNHPLRRALNQRIIVRPCGVREWGKEVVSMMLSQCVTTYHICTYRDYLREGKETIYKYLRE
jgi:hypothetical protein